MNRNRLLWMGALVIVVALGVTGVSLAASSTQEATTPQVILVLDVSGSMSAYVFPEELPEELATLIAQVDAIEDDPEYVRLIQQMDAITEDPEVVEVYRSWGDAEVAIEDWLLDHDFEPYDLISEVDALLEEYGCPDQWGWNIVSDANDAEDVDQYMYYACDYEGVTLSEEQRQAIRDLVPYTGDPEYQALQAEEENLYSAYGEALSAKGYDELSDQLYQLRNEQSYWDLQDEIDALAEELGIPNRLDLAKLSAQALLNLSRLDAIASGREAPLALIRFSTGSKVLQSLTTDYDAIQEDSEALYPTGNTHIGRALLRALDELEENGDPDQPAAIVLLTDGVANGPLTADQIVQQIPPRARELGASICTVGFGNDEDEVDAELLQNLADATDGQYLFATSGEEMAAFFIACRQGLVSQVVDQLTGVIRVGETVEAGHIDVGDNIGELTLTLNYLQGRLVMEVVDPDGAVVDLTSQGVTVEQEENVQLVTIDAPQPGEWLVRVSGEEAPEAGAYFNVVVGTEQLPTPTPAPTSAPPTPTPASTPTPTPEPLFGLSNLPGAGVFLICGLALLFVLVGIGVVIVAVVVIRRRNRA
jgi:uncharacterized protein YegL